MGKPVIRGLDPWRSRAWFLHAEIGKDFAAPPSFLWIQSVSVTPQCYGTACCDLQIMELNTGGCKKEPLHLCY